MLQKTSGQEHFFNTKHATPLNHKIHYLKSDQRATLRTTGRQAGPPLLTPATANTLVVLGTGLAPKTPPTSSRARQQQHHCRLSSQL